uniref:Uncharacterized protein n=1 Tax=Fushun levivirus 2 TaxID=2905458 RepID=A0A8K1XFE8_9VIRU|nr:MAG: hypothetical protein FLV2_gp2 [Fushun levivirus 2]
MFADPSTVTINGVAKALVRINQDSYGSEYFLREATQEFRMKIRNTSYTNAAGQTIDRHNIEFTQTIYATLTAAAIVRKSYIVIENIRSDTDAGLLQTLNGFVAFITSGNIQKLLNYES